MEFKKSSKRREKLVMKSGIWLWIVVGKKIFDIFLRLGTDIIRDLLQED